MADLSLETQGFFPGRGRGWRQWEDAFLMDFALELGLRACAEQLRRPPADVALRISWLGIAMPADKVRLAPHGKAPKLEKKPSVITPTNTSRKILLVSDRFCAVWIPTTVKIPRPMESIRIRSRVSTRQGFP